MKYFRIEKVHVTCKYKKQSMHARAWLLTKGTGCTYLREPGLRKESPKRADACLPGGHPNGKSCSEGEQRDSAPRMKRAHSRARQHPPRSLEIAAATAPALWAQDPYRAPRDQGAHSAGMNAVLSFKFSIIVLEIWKVFSIFTASKWHCCMAVQTRALGPFMPCRPLFHSLRHMIKYEIWYGLQKLFIKKIVEEAWCEYRWPPLPPEQPSTPHWLRYNISGMVSRWVEFGVFTLTFSYCSLEVQQQTWNNIIPK